MKFALFAAIVVILFLAGCTSPPPPTPPSQQPQPASPAKTCRTVIDQIPHTETKCGEFSFSEPVCGLRKLNYSMTLLPKVDLCTIDGPCAGEELSECQHCGKAMTRCVMVIKNEETVQSGTWVVGANYTLGNAMFLKDPISILIAPGESAAFDFNQIYDLGQPINSASCELFITKEPTVQDCITQQKSKYECRNVTEIQNVSRQVCE